MDKTLSSWDTQAVALLYYLWLEQQLGVDTEAIKWRSTSKEKWRKNLLCVDCRNKTQHRYFETNTNTLTALIQSMCEGAIKLVASMLLMQIYVDDSLTDVLKVVSV